MDRIRILFLAANPDSTTPLHAGREVRDIREKLARAADPRAVEVIERWAVRPGDLQQALLDVRPHIVHFSGHGNAEYELMLEGDDGSPRPVGKGLLAELFRLRGEGVRLVVLSACHSLPQAEAVAEHVDCAIGMRRAIGSEAAAALSAVLYQGIASGDSIQRAFEAARLHLETIGIPEHRTPQLVVRRDGVDPARTVLRDRTQTGRAGVAAPAAAPLGAEILRGGGVSVAPAEDPPPAPQPQGQPEDPRFARHLAKLEADITAQLRRKPQVALALAGELGLSASESQVAPRVAHTLLHEKTGKEMVMALNVADEELKDDATRAGDRRVLKRILLQVLPFASDWRPWVRQGRSALASGARFVDLPLSDLTLAEVVLAGIDCRPCRYETQGRVGPLSPAIVRLPAAEGAFMDRLAEATVGLLAVQLLGLSPDAAELRDHARIQRRVNEALQFYTEVTGDKYLPRWLLVSDELLGDAGRRAEEDQDRRVAAVVTVLSRKLPFLRILRLGEGVDGETNLALHIDGMWRKRIGDE